MSSMIEVLAVLALLLVGCTDDDPAVPEADAGPEPLDAQVACPEPTGETIHHNQDVTADERWAGDGTVHAIDFGISIRAGATLTLEPCAAVTIAPGLVITVWGDATAGRPARLVAEGTPEQPVTIRRQPNAGAWSELRALDAASFIDLSFTTIEGGGVDNGAMVHLRGAGDPLTVEPTLRAVSLTLRDATSTALWLESGAAFTDDSSEVVINGGGPEGAGGAGGDLRLTPRAINTLPSVNIADNQQNIIEVADGLLQIERDVHVPYLAVPYHFRFDRVRVHSETGTPRLVIQEGVELQFDDYLVIGFTGATPEEDQPGVLEVNGTASAPVVFTSFAPTRAAGDWPGIWLKAASGSSMEHARIEAAGGPNGIVSANCRPSETSDDAALLLGWSGYIPTADDFTAVEIVDSAGHGVNAMWTSATFGPDVTANMTFTNVAGCRQTRNGRDTGCGDEAGCLVP